MRRDRRSAYYSTSKVSDFEHLAKALKDSCEKLDRKYQKKAMGKL
jgi:hypothetical protein